MKNTFTCLVKEEIMELKFDKKNLKPLIKAFLKNNVVFSISGKNYNWEITSQMPKVLRFIYEGISNFVKIEKKFFYSNENNLNKKKTYKMVFCKNLDKLDENLGITDNDYKFLNNWNSKRAFLAGLFLSAGSVNSPNSKTYHLELRLRNQILSKNAVECFNYFNLDPRILTKNDKIVVYLKKSENISDFLKLLNAKNSMFIFEEARINKDYFNQLHRLNNLDVSNLKKTVEASEKINKYIKFIIDKKNVFENLSEKEKYFCKIKIQNPELSFEEISDYFKKKLNIKITKSAINHYSRKIKTIYKELNGDINE